MEDHIDALGVLRTGGHNHVVWARRSLGSDEMRLTPIHVHRCHSFPPPQTNDVVFEPGIPELAGTKSFVAAIPSEHEPNLVARVVLVVVEVTQRRKRVQGMQFRFQIMLAVQAKQTSQYCGAVKK